tara:strand:+ start:544 stop:687 length:144 start_codon:yes stop_codon:yes gene_type:complete
MQKYSTDYEHDHHMKACLGDFDVAGPWMLHELFFSIISRWGHDFKSP